jgi:hypothetical protein
MITCGLSQPQSRLQLRNVDLTRVNPYYYPISFRVSSHNSYYPQFPRDSLHYHVSELSSSATGRSCGNSTSRVLQHAFTETRLTLRAEGKVLGLPSLDHLKITMDHRAIKKSSFVLARACRPQLWNLRTQVPRRPQIPPFAYKFPGSTFDMFSIGVMRPSLRISDALIQMTATGHNLFRFLP